MDIQTRAISAIAVLLALILLAMGLRHLGLVKEEHGPLLSRLVTRVTLPGLIFESLARPVLHRELALLALIMRAAELLCLALAWLGGRALRLPRPQLGSVILAAGFGSSALLGYALVSQIYGAGSPAIADAMVVSELGVGPALFTLGTMIAIATAASAKTTAHASARRWDSSDRRSSSRSCSAWRGRVCGCRPPVSSSIPCSRPSACWARRTDSSSR